MVTKIIFPSWSAPKNIFALTTTKNFGDLSLLKKTFDLPFEPCWLQQVHGNAVVNLDHCQDKSPLTHNSYDGSYTSESNIACVVRTADCLPILICNKNGTEIAALHGGWRSLLANIIFNGVKLFQSHPKDLLVWLGPAISQQHFEIGLEVKDLFTKQNKNFENCFKPSPCPQSPPKFFADLYEIAKLQLYSLGMTNIYGGDYCTFANAKLFYSYRRAKDVGRMATIIMINSSTFSAQR